MAKLNELKTIGKHPIWCGPSALSMLTGRSINHCAKLIAQRRNSWGWYRGKGTSKQVKGVDNHEMFRALEAMRFTYTPVTIRRTSGFRMPTLRHYMAGRGGQPWKEMMLIEVTGHYVVACRDIVSDSHQQDVHYSEHCNRLMRVKRAWIVKRSKVR